MTLCNANKKISCTECDAIKQQWSAAVKAYEKGLFSAIGVSNYCTQCLQCLKDLKRPMALPVPAARSRVPTRASLAMNAARGIVSQAYSPIGSGGHGSSDILSGPLTTKIAKAHNKSTAQVALKYLVQLNAAVVTKSSSPEHLKQDVELFDWSLTRRDMKELAAATFASDDTPSFECDNPSSAAARAAGRGSVGGILRVLGTVVAVREQRREKPVLSASARVRSLLEPAAPAVSF